MPSIYKTQSLFPCIPFSLCTVLQFFFLIFSYFTVLYWFCHRSTWICHGCTRVPHPERLSHLPPRTIPLSHPSAPAPSILYRTWTGKSFLTWYYTCFSAIFPGRSAVKNLPAMQELQETRVWSLGWEDPLEKGMTPHSSILAWSIPWGEKPGGLQSIGSQRVGQNWRDFVCTHIF